MRFLRRETAGWVAVALLAAGVTAGDGSAKAAMITDSVPIPGFSDIGVDVFVPQFDPALGTLTGVSASLTGQFTPAVSFDQAPPPSLSPVQLNPSITLAAVYQDTNLYGIDLTQSLGTEFVPIVNGHEVVGTPEAVAIMTTLPLTGSSVSYTGLGSLNFYITGSSGVSPSYSSYVVNEQAGLSGQVAVTYTYTPGTAVPEPASLALLGTGLLGLCAVRSRGRRSALS